MSFILLGQFVLMYGVLFLVLDGLARRYRDCSRPRVALITFAVCIGTIFSVALLVTRVRWMAAVPALAVAALLLYDFSWSYLWHTFVVILIFSWSSTFLFVQLEAREEKPEAEAARSARKRQDAGEVVRYQQAADKLKLAPTKKKPRRKKRRPAPPSRPEASAPQQVIVIAPEPEPTPEAVPEPPPPPEPALPQEWTRAKEQLRVGGTIAMQNDKYVALIDGKIVEENGVVSAEYEGHIYRWRVRAVGAKKIEWDEIDVIPVK